MMRPLAGWGMMADAIRSEEILNRPSRTALFSALILLTLALALSACDENPEEEIYLEPEPMCVTCCACTCTCEDVDRCGIAEIERSRSDNACLICDEVCRVGCAEHDYPLWRYDGPCEE